MSLYPLATLKFFRCVLENCVNTDGLITDNMLKALCMLYNFEQTWFVLELVIRRFGIDMTIYQLFKIQKSTNNAFAEVEEGAVFYCAKIVLDSCFHPAICPLLVLSDVADYVRTGKVDVMLKKILPMLAVYVERKALQLTAEWYYVWSILEAGNWHSKRDSQSAGIVYDIVSKACATVEAKEYKGNFRQLAAVMEQFRSLLPDKLFDLRLTLI